MKGGVLHAYLTEPAEAGRANRQLVREMSRIFGPCRIVRGASSRGKLLELPPASPAEMKQRLEAAYL